MEITEHIDALRREGNRLAEAAARTELSAPVPTCPEWQLADLLRHIGSVHRWAAAIVSQGLPAPLDETGTQAAVGPLPSDATLLDWYREGHTALVDALTAAPADVECWSFLPSPSPLAFWARRQAHETAVHRHDADAAAGAPGPAVDTALALDGIDELVSGFMTSSRSTLRSDRPRTLQVRATDGAGSDSGTGSWRLTITQEPPTVTTGESPEPADLTLAGPARELYPLLWNRLPFGQARDVVATGDQGLLDLWRDAAAIR
ncbi:maleylpyruvate isomerase N-terminal domain-containing protein [Streptomyces sp. LS1784]|uniref:maleylpyruvate isomerase N-terminal domain-containing protein n=1 Tax=Streptomyces sp. LS1784 TaxID=2851533 RepID=UPI001CCB5D8E|nr:maleylpyruvate isomerase N-terminal domain-containing protein [Streptomyces sp. LS1784]